MEETYVTDYLQHLRRKGKQADTIADYGVGLRAYAQYLATTNIAFPFAACRETVEGYYRTLLDSGFCSSTIHRRAHAVHDFYAWLKEQGCILVNPCPAPPPRTQGLPCNVPAIEALRKVYGRLGESTTLPEQRDLAMIDLAYGCGLRRCELHRLNVQDVNANEGTVRVRGKRDVERLVPIGQQVLTRVLDYIYHTRPYLLKAGTTNALFVSWKGGGKRMHLYSINAAFRRLRHRYGFSKDLAPHALRHAFATGLLTNGAPVQDVSRMLGHRKLETTQVYTRLTIRDLKDHYSRYHPRG